jgi:hypothetical protein
MTDDAVGNDAVDDDMDCAYGTAMGLSMAILGFNFYLSKFYLCI